jgi:hypothetical protein
VGVKHHLDAQASDNKSGPAAVIRNVAQVFRGMDYQGRRLIVTDRFYTSIPMVQQLRTMGFTFIGTIQKSRLGWCHGVEYPHKKRPKTMPRGVFKMASAVSDPGLVALGWMDNRPVYMLGSNVSTTLTSVARREKNGAVTNVPCPQMMKDYQTYMGGVDKHDQLRLQSYSLQLANRFVKYYKSLFWGLVDMAIVNGYIIHNMVLQSIGVKEKDHLSYMEELQASLVTTAASDFNIDSRVGRGGLLVHSDTSDHVLAQSSELREHHGVRRFMQRSCKVCSVYKVRLYQFGLGFPNDLPMSFRKN